MTISFNRRTFLAGAGASLGASLTIPFVVPGVAKASGRAGALNAYLRIEADGAVTVLSPVSEMGQGTHTGYAAIIADELGVTISAIRVVVPEQPAKAYRLFFGQMRSVGSYGIRAWIGPLRKAAAQARAVLAQAAAKRWSVPASSVEVADGRVRHAASGRSATFAQLVAAARALPLPEKPQMRDPKTRRYVGRAVRRIDTPPKTDGSAIYGIDVRRPGMLYGAAKLSPVYGAAVERIDRATAAAATAVAEVPHGAVVISDGWWKAKKLADGLAVSWKPTAFQTTSSTDISRRFRAGLDARSAPVAVNAGDVDAAFARGGRIVTADYEVPFLAHLAMEPISCVGQWKDGRIDVWLSTQGHDEVRVRLKAATGVPDSKIFIHTTFLGGGFGRKTHGEIAVQAVLASRAVDGRPVNVIWTRENDVQQGQYRPAMAARLRAALNADGSIAAMAVRLAGPVMGKEYAHIVRLRNNFDFLSHAVVGKHAYMPANYRLEHAEVRVPPSSCPWRSVSSSQNGFFLEAFIDELAHAAGQDPMAYRRARLARSRSHLACLDSVARRSGWGKPLPGGKNWGRGVAIVESYDSRCAQVAEVEMVDGAPVVRKVWVAIDCGEAVNPGQIEAQMMGSVIDGLGPALRCQVTLKDGRAEQSNYDSYPILRMNEAPEIDVEVVNTGAKTGGVGEPGLPPVAPAVANAVFAATGQRRRTLPLISGS